MHRFKKVGVVLDIENLVANAVKEASNFVKHNRSAVHIICATPMNLLQKQADEVKSFLNDITDFKYTLTFLHGKPAVEISQYAAANEIDMLLIAAEQQSGLKRIFFSPLSLSLVRKAPCAVWVVKGDEESHKKILIPIDPDEEVTAPDLNDKLLEIGTSYAKLYGAEVIILTAWYLAGEGLLESPRLGTSKAEIRTMKEEISFKHAQNLKKVVDRKKTILKDVEVKTVEGEPGHTIVDFVNKHAIDMVIMGTVSRTGISGFVIGNTAETVVNQIQCSLMAIKPDGFVSPFLS